MMVDAAERPILVGVDGGGTRCRVRARYDGGAPIGSCVTGTANILAGIDVARANILAAVEGALAEGGLSPDHMAKAYVGMGLAGANIPDLAEAFLATGLPFRRVALEMDAWIACRGARPEADGGIAILGTGTAYVMRTGRDFRSIGGWGFQIGDQASGAWLGHQALRRAAFAFDGLAPRSPLTDEVLLGFNGHPDGMVAFGRDAKPADYGGFAPHVFRHAEAGDPNATAIIAEAVADIETALARLQALGAGTISLLGGLAALYEPLLSPAAAAGLAPPVADALEGALALAASLVDGAGSW